MRASAALDYVAQGDNSGRVRGAGENRRRKEVGRPAASAEIAAVLDPMDLGYRGEFGLITRVAAELLAYWEDALDFPSVGEGCEGHQAPLGPSLRTLMVWTGSDACTDAFRFVHSFPSRSKWSANPQSLPSSMCARIVAGQFAEVAFRDRRVLVDRPTALVE